MSTAKVETSRGFAIWITGLPASGKSTISGALVAKLKRRGVAVAVLESDVLRRVLGHGYDEAGRASFYDAMTWIGSLLVRNGVSVVFDATANKRAFRERARREIVDFIEVWVDTPLEVCMERDPKGIYGAAREGKADAVPGLQDAYEPSDKPDIVVHGDSEDPEAAADRIIEKIRESGFI